MPGEVDGLAVGAQFGERGVDGRVRSLASVYAWVSWSGKGGVKRVWWWRTSSNPHRAACSSMAASSL
ncbi:hypothetical protein ACFQ3Z_06195 [Streptomyces nogalater]